MTTIKTISQLYSEILADLTTAYGDSIPVFGKIFLRAVAMVQAGKLKLFYLALGLVQKNVFPDTADQEALGGTLERFGRVKLNRNPFAATAGQYSVEVTGTIGSTIVASTTFKSNDDSLSPGMLFVLDTTHVMVSTTDTITLRALNAGLGSKLSVSDGLTSTSPIAGVNSLVIVASEDIQPLAAEDIEDYRQSVLDAFRLEPQGGAASDYRLWANDAQGVYQTYPFARTGYANEINLYIEATTADSTDGHGTPSGLLLAAVEAVVELDPDTTKPILERGRRPLGVFQVHYLPVSPKQVDIQITGFVGITAAIQTLISEAIAEALTTVRPFVAGADVLVDRNDIFSQNSVVSIILAARPGSVFGAIQLTVGGSVESSHQFVDGDTPYLGNITYV